MNVSANLWVGAISLAAALVVQSATTEALRVVAPVSDPKSLTLPRSATVTDRDASGKRWEYSGEIAGSITVARKDFEIALNRQGWQRKNTIPTGLPGQAAELQTWMRGNQSLLLMLSEDAPARTSFHAGRTSTTPPRAP